MLGSLIVLYWLYMGSQSRFYARWMLPLYPALAILAAYASRRSSTGRLRRARRADADPRRAHDGPQRARARPRGHAHETRDWLVANVPQGTKVAFEPIAPTEWYGVTPGGGAEGRPRAAVGALQPQPGDHRRARARLPRRALPGELPELRAHAHARADRRLPARGRLLGRHRVDAVRPRAGRVLPRARRRSSTTGRCASRPTSRSGPARSGRATSCPRYQVDKSFNYVEGAYDRPGPEMIVYKLRDCALIAAC